MQNMGIPLLLILVSAIPAGAAFLWFRLSRYPFSCLRILASLFIGASSIFPALLLQSFFAGIFPPVTDTASLLVEFFVRIAFAEELGRILLLAPLLLVFGRLDLSKPRQAPEATGMACGLFAGLGFGILESAIYGIASPMNALLRAFTSTPLHAACGARVGSAAAILREKPVSAFVRFASAVAIHGVYNLLVPLGNLAFLFAILIVFSSLASSVLGIARGMRAEDAE